MNDISTPEELSQEIGESIRLLRLQENLTQHALAARAGVSLTALRHLEAGQGANLGTLIRVVRALNKEEWLKALAPRITINPLHMTASVVARQRARTQRSKRTRGPEA